VNSGVLPRLHLGSGGALNAGFQAHISEPIDAE
jgi:hypothetical protein